MTFTDDDLKRLKKLAKSFPFPKSDHLMIKVSEAKALLARLEAAEKVCNKIHHVRDTVNQRAKRSKG